VVRTLYRRLTLAFAIFVAAGAAAFVAVRVGAGDRGTTNRDAGLTDEERDAKYKALSRDSATSQAQLDFELATSGTAIATLPRSQLLLDIAVPDEDLGGLVRAAQAVVEGTVTDQRLVVSANSAPVVVSTISVVDWIKGGPNATTIELRQVALATRRDDGSLGLAVIAADPVPYPRQHLVIFVQAEDPDGRMIAVPGSTLVVDAGVVEPNPANARLAPLKGLGLGDLRTRIAAAVQ
jgi:hypothetical protein